MAVFLLVRHHLEQFLDDLQPVRQHRGPRPYLQVAGQRQVIAFQFRVLPEELGCVEQVELEDDVRLFQVDPAALPGQAPPAQGDGAGAGEGLGNEAGAVDGLLDGGLERGQPGGLGQGVGCSPSTRRA